MIAVFLFVSIFLSWQGLKALRGSLMSGKILNDHSWHNRAFVPLTRASRCVRKS